MSDEQGYGSHLLGRVPSKPDDRDFPLSIFLDGSDPLDAALRNVSRSFTTSHAVKVWATIATQRIEGATPAPPGPTPDPTPTPTPVSGGWLDSDDPVLDQGNTGHCVGFTGADWENALPVDDHVGNSAGEDIYYACKVVDGEPKQENGSTVRSLMKVLQARGKLKTYAAANTIDDVWQFVSTSGPVCWGIGWTNSMFTPDDTGLVVPQGADVGGHAIIQYGVEGDYALLLNHWGSSWGVGGKFRMHKSDLAERLANQGEAWAAVEIAA